MTVVCPGFFATNLLAGARFHTEPQRQSAGRLMQSARLSAEDVARAILRAVARRQLYLVLPARARLFWRLRRLWPAAMMKLVARITARARQEDTAAAAAETATAPDGVPDMAVREGRPPVAGGR